MNTPNPLVPQGTFLDKGKSRFRIMILGILACHLVFLGVLLGCNKKASTDQAQDSPPTPPSQSDQTGTWPTPPPSSAATSQVAAAVVQHDTPPPTPPATDAANAAGGQTPPPVPQTHTETAASGLVDHTISKGESFYTLGRKYSVSYKAIADANPGVNPNRLQIGDKVKIPPAKSPGGAALAGVAGPGTDAVDGTARSYKVKSGDTLGKIAKIHTVSIQKLRSLNNLKTDRITVGQVLKIPPKTAPTALDTPPGTTAGATPPPAVP